MDAPAVFRFGAFELDGRRFELRLGGASVGVQPKTLELLLHLVTHRDRFVSKDELLAALWPDVAVSEASLSKAVAGARRALGDDAHQQAWIQTVRGRGFRFVGKVAPLAPSAVVAPGALPGDEFVGRNDVLQALDDAADAARAGGGRLVLLGGEPGMGKTRAAQEGARRARASGLSVLQGWCGDTWDAPALWPWLQILRALLAGRDADARAELTAGLGEGLADLTALLPSLREYLPSEPASSGLDPSQARLRLFDTAATLLRRAARAQPMLVALDDVHWADADSLVLLDLLVRELGEASIALVATARFDELAETHPLRALARRPECRKLELAGLARDEVARLAASELGGPVLDEVASALRDATGGNPFFVKELARALDAEGRLESGSALAAGAPLPDGVRSVLGTRLARLPAACREALRIAAVVGRDFELALLARVAERPPDRVLALLEEGASAGVVHASGGGWQFAHALLREAVLADLPAPERARLHRRVGEALEAQHAGDLGPVLSRIAQHLCAGAPSGGVPRAIEHARRAAERAARLLAHEEAATHYRRALDLQSLAPHPDDVERSGLLLGLGEALMAMGEQREARATLRHAAELARQRREGRLLARAALAYGGLELSIEIGVHDPELIRLLEEALAALADEPSALRVRLLIRLGIALWWSGTPSRSGELTREAVTLARTSGDAEALAHALYGRRWTRLGPDELPTRLVESGELLDAARAAGRRDLELAGRSCRFLDLVELGRIDAADRELQVYARLADEMRVPRYRWRTLVYRSMRAVIDGRFGEAETLASGALDLGHRFGAEDAESTFAISFATLRREEGRTAELEPAVKQLVERFPAVTTWRAALFSVHAELGHEAEARAGLEALAVDGFTALPYDMLRLPALTLLGEVCVRLGDAARAAEILALLRPYAGRAVVVGAGVTCWGALDRTLGLLAAAAGDLDGAASHLEAALAFETRMGARPWLGWTELARAEVLFRRGRSGDDRTAMRALEHAREVAQSLGMSRLAARAAALG